MQEQHRNIRNEKKKTCFLQTFSFYYILFITDFLTPTDFTNTKKAKDLNSGPVTIAESMKDA